jgi:O-antigen ligase
MTPLTTLGTLILSLLIVPIVFAVCLKAPRLPVLGFIVVLFLFPYANWGQLVNENTIYARGAGLFYFSLLNILLLIAGIAALVRKLANPKNPVLVAPLAPYFLGFVFLMACHVVMGLMANVDIDVILGYNGFINVLNMLVFMYLIVMAFNTEKDKRNLLWLFLALAAGRALFGLVRFLWFGGDSANPYANFEKIDIKLFFFDIADNYVCALAAFITAWLLTSPAARLSFLKRLALYGFLALQVTAVALSFRRSSLIGLALMFCLLLYLLPGIRRMKFMVLAMVLLSVTALVFFQQRLQFAGNGGDVLSSLIYDINPNNGNDRFYELYAAARSIGDNWLFGLGSWGTYTGDQELMAYHFGKFEFVHSGFGHLVLKVGVAGLALFVFMLISYSSFYLKRRKSLTGNSRLLADAGFAGLLFWIPTLLIGTPIIEFRTMMLIGLTLAMPYVAVGLETYKARNPYYAMA